MTDRASAASPTPSAEAAPTSLNEKDVEFIVFEGGGGKGFAFLGAIDMLERKRVMDHVRGFGGASAGAITALLLSIGYNAAQLTTFLKDTDFDEFYDPPEPRIRPSPYTPGLPVTDTSPAEQAFMEGDITLWLGELIAGDGSSPVRHVLGNGVAGSPLLRIAQYAAAKEGHDLIESVLRSRPVPAIARALLGDGRLMKYLAFLPRDMGLFSGAAARALFEHLLQQAAAKRNGGLPSTYSNLGFQRHYEIFGKELLFTGTNLRSGKTQLFSRTATPYFPVANAVRISMGLPWVFKPYVIESQNDKKDPPCGVYVDGGVWNNLPFREFDSVKPTKTKSSAAARGQRGRGKGPRTLGLRLEITPMASVSSVWELTAQMLAHGVLGSGESQVLDKYASQCILLDTRGLDLLTFSPPKDPKAQLRISNRSARAVCSYFGWPVKDIMPSIVDDKDDRATEKARRAATAC